MSDIQNKIDDYAAKCNGTENYHRHELSRLVYSDGVKLVAVLCRAYWLIDRIFLNQRLKVFREQEFQVWKLDCDIGHLRATLICGDGDGNEVFKELIPFTDFLIPEIEFYFENGVLCLPCER